MSDSNMVTYNEPACLLKTYSYAEIAQLIHQRQIKHVKVGITDINGVLRGKYLSTKKFLSALEHGFGFCDVIMGSDIDDQLCSGLSYTGWQSGYPDAKVNIVAESCREIPYEPQTLFFLAEFSPSHAQLCPRQLLKRVIQKASDMDLFAYCALEFEFTLFNQSIDEVHQAGFKHLQPFTPANCGYSILRVSRYAEFYQELLDLCEQMHMPLESLHTEIGPGVLEAALVYDTALAAADKAVLFKTFAKVFAQRHDLVATFMAKWHIDQQGHSGHTHLSLRDASGNHVFYDPAAPHQMSQAMRHFIAGQQQLMPELLAMVAPTVNSFSRLVPGFWAPTQAAWGVDNRTCALRVIAGSESSQRIEYRVPGADCNPYLAVAVALASGLWGIEQQLEPTEPIVGNAYEVNLPSELQLPRSLSEAAGLLRQSQMAKEYFGESFVNDYAATREWEQRQAQRQVTDWQLQRYLELA